MLDSGKIEGKNKLAKKLVEQRIAANMEDAMNKIENHDDLIKEEDVEIVPNEEELEKKENKEVVQELDKDTASRLVELENKVKILTDYFNMMKDTMNNNFREIDQRLNEIKKIRQKIEKAKEEPKSQESTIPGKSETSSPTEELVEEEVEEEKPKQAEKTGKKAHPKCDPDNYEEKDVSVEHVFSNAHGRLEKRSK